LDDKGVACWLIAGEPAVSFVRNGVCMAMDQ
jgi:hypothetical protein